MNDEPKKVSADHNPKGVITNYRNFVEDSDNRSIGHYERDNASEEHFGPKVTDRIIKETVEGFTESAGSLIRFAIMAGNAYFEAMPKKPIELPPEVAKAFVKHYYAEPTALTRRRDRNLPQECWRIYYGDAHAGTIAECVGNPGAAPRWQWRCGFYPGSRAGECTNGTAATFQAAREAFEAAWRIFLARRTEADFQAWRDQQA